MILKALALLSKYNLPSSRLRIRDMVSLLRKNNIDLKVEPFAKNFQRFFQIISLSKYDVVIIQKKTSLRAIELYLIKKFSRKIIYDFDDACMFHELEHSKPLKGKNFMKFLNTINIADAVVAGNDFLRSFCIYNTPKVYKLPTPVDTQKYFPSKSQHKKLVTLGWIGVSGSMRHLYNLQPVFKELSKKYKFELLVISNQDFICKGITVRNIHWELDRENEYLNLIDIGLMPLDDSIWTNGKCGYKLVQYGAVGIPSVASSVGINKEIILDGKTGYLASNKDAWIESLVLLIKNADLRKTMGSAARKHIAKNFSLSVYAEQYAMVMKSIV
jgi:glycosyltransferase involved in cell wall biosynthesis